MRGTDGDIPPYHKLDIRALTQALYHTTNDLIAAIDEKATAEKSEGAARIHGYFESGSSTERGREMDGKRASMTAAISVIELSSQIAMLTEEKYLIIRMIDLRMAGVLESGGSG